MLVASVILCLCWPVRAQLDASGHVFHPLTGEELTDNFDTPGEPKYWSNWNRANDSQHWYHSFYGDPNPLDRRGQRPPFKTPADGFLEVVPVDDPIHSGDPAHLHSKYLRLQPGSSLEILYWNTVPTLSSAFDLTRMDVQLYDGSHSHIYRFQTPQPDQNQWQTAVIPLQINDTSTVQVTGTAPGFISTST